MGRTRAHIAPIERLGRWDGAGFEPIEPGSLRADAIVVMSHGWAPGLRPVINAADGFVRVWDETATTGRGDRFDPWYAPLATAVHDAIDDVAVLGFTWVDESATGESNLQAIRSQRRTTANGQRLAVAIRDALAPGIEPRIHLVGFSHGARIVAVAGALMQPAPVQVTLLDSPEGALAVAGGALNDLTSYLRVLSRYRSDGPVTRIDNYPSFFGIEYGSLPAAGDVVDVRLSPFDHPFPHAPKPTNPQIAGTIGHDYAPIWYVHSAKHHTRGVGFGWSTLVDPNAWPGAVRFEQDGDDPLDLKESTRPSPERAGDLSKHSRTESTRVLSTEGRRSVSKLVWRNRGDLLAAVPLRWLAGPDDATVRVHVGGTERALAVKGWGEQQGDRLLVPLGDIRRGPTILRATLESSEPAAVEIGQTTSVYTAPLPAFAEFRSWLVPLAATVSVGAMAGLVVALIRRATRRRRRGT